MRKKLLSLTLALVICLSLSVPAFAAKTLTGNQLYGEGWGNGPSITLTGVVGEAETQFDPSYIYDVEVGGSLTLEMTYPAGKNRSYSIMNGGFYVPHDLKEPDWDDEKAMETLGETWDIPASAEGGDFNASSGKTRFVYTFTASDMGQKNGMDKIIYPMIYWCDDADNDGAVDLNADGSSCDGSVYFGIRVVPAASKPENIAYASTQTVDVDGTPVKFQMYALKDAKGNPTNYIKLRDLAFAIGQVQEGFAVEWKNGAVNINTKKSYTSNGSEMSTPFSGNRPYEMSATPTIVDGKSVNLNAFILKDDKGGAFTYYQLRDLGKALGFNVGWSKDKGVFVETDKPYSGTN